MYTNLILLLSGYVEKFWNLRMNKYWDEIIRLDNKLWKRKYKNTRIEDIWGDNINYYKVFLTENEWRRKVYILCYYYGYNYWRIKYLIEVKGYMVRPNSSMDELRDIFSEEYLIRELSRINVCNYEIKENEKFEAIVM